VAGKSGAGLTGTPQFCLNYIGCLPLS
jgi:hypothetical protein